jgi:DNA-binding winged helix-turn-helix (wHTH) protein
MEVAIASRDEKADRADHISFGEYTIDLVGRGLYREGVRIRLTPKPFETLIYLAERSGRTIEKRELLGAIWEGTHVTEGTLAHAIKEIRRALSDDKDNPRFILTVHRRGYRFVCSVSSSKTNPIPICAQEDKPSQSELLRTGIDWKLIALASLAFALTLTLALLY